MVAFFIVVLLFIAGISIIGYLLSGPRYKGPVTEHFDGKKFINPGGIKAQGLSAVLKWMISRKRGPWKHVNKFSSGEKPPAKVEEGIRITFVNHSTFLIQTNGINILTDPVWSERTSPFQFAGPKRKRNPGIKYEDLPKIDLVLLSHNHYDHIDLPVLKKIFINHHPHIITPLGVKKFLKQKGIFGNADLDWWDNYSFNKDLQITATPAQHFSGRGSFDRDATLWCGYMIKSKSGSVYFAGDTGYNNKMFNEIRIKFPSIDIALIPIGAYKPTWFMSPIHCSPDEAVQIHQDVNARQSIATHFGTFALADEGGEEPVKDLHSALLQKSIPKDEFIALKEGEFKIFLH